MSQINVTTIRNRTGGPPSLDQGVVVGSAATFSSTVSIAGVLTYEDVTNVDSVGIITARTGLKVTAGGIDVTAGGIDVTAGGINVTAGIGTFAALTGTTGTFSGAVAGTTGTFSGAVAGTTGTFSGAVAGTTGTFSGAVAGTTGTFTSTGTFGDEITASNASLSSFKLDYNSSQYDAYLQLRGNDLEIRGSSGQMEFYTGSADGASSTERMRLTDGGQLLINTTSNGSDAEPALIVSGRANDATDSGMIRIKRGENAASMSAGDSVGDITFSAVNGGQCAQVFAKAATGWSGTSDSPGELIFKTTSDGSGTPTERLYITSSGDVQSKDSVQSGGNGTAGWLLGNATGTTAYIAVQGKSNANGGADGNAVFQAWHGSTNTIRFNNNGAATFSGNITPAGLYLGGTGTANHLDDYEEGSWTPALTSDWTSVTYTIQRGRYIKIGNMVYIYYTLQMSAATSPGGSYAFAIKNLPFQGYDYLAGYFGGGVSGSNIDSFVTDNWTTVFYGGAGTSFTFNDQGGNTSLRCGSTITSTSHGYISGWLIYSADTFA